MEKKRIEIMGIAFLGSIAVTVVFVLGTVFTGRSASSGTEKAVRNVSLLYLNELATRREQVVADKLADYISDLDIAIGLLDTDDLSSVQKLQSFQARMKHFYELEKFAFVDENGLIYTSRGTRTDIDQYNFDYKTLSKTEISLKNQESEGLTLVVAAPIDRLPFNEETLVACFMEISLSRLLEGFSLQSGISGTDTTFCNIYTKDGTTITKLVLGGLASENNLFVALKRAKFDKGYSAQEIESDFAARKEGVASFTYNGIRDTMFYVPVRRTNWMLTYLIRESVIGEQISSISSGIIGRSVLMSIISAVILISLFAVMFMQMRKTAKITLSKEIADAENRVQQEELEEQLALQQQIARQERMRNEQSNMITAMASDYRSVYYVDLNTDSGICYRKDKQFPLPFNEGEKIPFKSTFIEYAYKFVVESDRKKFLEFIDTKAIKEGLSNHNMISIRYLVNHGGKESYEMFRMAGVHKADERAGSDIQFVGMGFTDIDEEMRDSLAKSEALRDALKAAEEASKAKTVFLSNMSHEIRTPMNAIIGLDSLALHEEDLPPKTRGYLEKIGSSAEHLLSLINDILDMSRIESGRMVIRNEEFSFSKILEQVNTIASGQCSDKGLEYICRVKGHLDEYYIGDDTKIRQVLINILGNAVKFTDKGGKVSFVVEKTAGFDKKSTLRFEISDTGIGMSKEYLPKIFDTFSQEDATAANKYGSSGLGMAITKNIVDMMNGEISVQSEKGKGSTFTVTLTLQDSERKVSDSEIEIKPAELLVLVVDDDEVAAEHAKLVLSKAGIESETALSGEAAVEMVKLRHARREPYNLIIVDWQMPGMDGVETTRKIREATGDESAIIILTAYNWDDIQDEAKNVGVDSFIAKPIFTGNLLEEFKNALQRKQSAANVGKKKADLKGKRVLLAEDVEVNAMIMIEVLQMRDMEAEHAENGRIALEMFEKSEIGYYDAILMDMRMPEMDGLEATAAIRKLDRADAKKIPIIALTANAFDEDVQRSLQAGLNAHLSKPVQPDVLFETLEGML